MAIIAEDSTLYADEIAGRGGSVLSYQTVCYWRRKYNYKRKYNL